MYLIRGLAHDPDGSMGCHAFSIELAPEFRDAVEKSGLTQEFVDAKIAMLREVWQKATGLNHQWSTGIRVKWGEWGPEHITVPGNACGLDLDSRAFGVVLDGGRRLDPHNIDSLAQKYLLLIVFTTFAEDVALFARTGGWKPKRKEAE